MTILVRCADPRINIFLEEIGVADQLGILKSDYAVISNTGSIRYFIEKSQLEDFYKQLEILVYHFKADRISLLNHTDCGFYKSIGKDDEDNYLTDLKEIKTKLNSKFPDLRIDGYLMDTETGGMKNEAGEKIELPYTQK